MLRVESSVMVTPDLRYLTIICGTFINFISRLDKVKFMTEAMPVFALTLMAGVGWERGISQYQIPQCMTETQWCDCQHFSGKINNLKGKRIFETMSDCRIQENWKPRGQYMS